jgi:hypothetical protein
VPDSSVPDSLVPLPPVPVVSPPVAPPVVPVVSPPVVPVVSPPVVPVVPPVVPVVSPPVSPVVPTAVPVVSPPVSPVVPPVVPVSPVVPPVVPVPSPVAPIVVPFVPVVPVVPVVEVKLTRQLQGDTSATHCMQSPNRLSFLKLNRLTLVPRTSRSKSSRTPMLQARPLLQLEVSVVSVDTLTAAEAVTVGVFLRPILLSTERAGRVSRGGCDSSHMYSPGTFKPTPSSVGRPRPRLASTSPDALNWGVNLGVKPEMVDPLVARGLS